MKDLVLEILTSRKGKIATVIASLVVTGVVHVLTEYQTEISQEVQNMIYVGTFGLVGWIIELVVSIINANGVRKIQSALPPYVKEDGYAGQVTVNAVQNLTKQSDVL